jgi:hypothetical protein
MHWQAFDVGDFHAAPALAWIAHWADLSSSW